MIIEVPATSYKAHRPMCDYIHSPFKNFITRLMAIVGDSIARHIAPSVFTIGMYLLAKLVADSLLEVESRRSPIWQAASHFVAVWIVVIIGPLLLAVAVRAPSC